LCEALGKHGLARPLLYVSYCNSCCIDKHMFVRGPRQKPMLPMPKTASGFPVIEILVINVQIFMCVYQRYKEISDGHRSKNIPKYMSWCGDNYFSDLTEG
jgi:hypothetical protein